RPIGATQYAHVGKLWHPAADRVVQPEFALVQQLQRKGHGDRLCHRGDAEDRGTIHRDCALGVTHSGRHVAAQLSLAPNLCYDTRDVTGFDSCAHSLPYRVALVREQRRCVAKGSCCCRFVTTGDGRIHWEDSSTGKYLSTQVPGLTASPCGKTSR